MKSSINWPDKTAVTSKQTKINAERIIQIICRISKVLQLGLPYPARYFSLCKEG
jgi:hypothetical protein